MVEIPGFIEKYLLRRSSPTQLSGDPEVLWGQLDEIWRARSEKNWQDITQLCQEQGYQLIVKDAGSVKILEIISPGLVVPSHVEQLAVEKLSGENKVGIANNCLPLSLSLVNQHNFSGIISGTYTSKAFLGNHYVPYLETSTGVIALDITAGYTLDSDSRHYKALLLYLPTLKVMMKTAKSIYGGNWTRVATK